MVRAHFGHNARAFFPDVCRCNQGYVDVVESWLIRNILFTINAFRTFLSRDQHKCFQCHQFAFAEFFQGRAVSRRAFLARAFEKTRRSEEHTSELQSLAYLVCRLLLEKKKISKGVRRQKKIRSQEITSVLLQCR